MRLLPAVFLAALLLALPAGHSWGAGFPALSGPAVYAGEFKQGHESYGILLVLTGEGKFLLQETFILPNGKRSFWEAAGKWSQIRGGAFLHLGNRHNFTREMNVGGAGNLYLSMQLPGGPMVTVTLRQQKRAPRDEELGRIALLEEMKPEKTYDRSLALNVVESSRENPVVAPTPRIQEQTRATRSPRRRKGTRSALKNWENGEALVQHWKSPRKTPEGIALPWQQTYMMASLYTSGGRAARSAAKTGTAQPLTSSGKRLERSGDSFAPWRQTYLLSSLPVGGKAPSPRAELATVDREAPELVVAIPPQFQKNGETPVLSWQQTYMLASLPDRDAGKGSPAGPAPQLAAAAITRDHKRVEASDLPWRWAYMLSSLPYRGTGKDSPAGTAATGRKTKRPRLTAVASAQSRKSVAASALPWQQTYMLSSLSAQGADRLPPDFGTATGLQASQRVAATPARSQVESGISTLPWQYTYMMSGVAPRQKKRSGRRKSSRGRRHVSVQPGRAGNVLDLWRENRALAVSANAHTVLLIRSGA